MDKEGQNVQFSSSKIPDKTVPDYFVGSNENQGRKKTSFGEKIKKLLAEIADAIKSYFSHPFLGRHKLVSIPVIVIILAVVVYVVLLFTIWRGPSDKEINTQEDYDAWEAELTKIVHEGNEMTEEEVNKYFADLINNTISDIKSIDLTIEYSRALAERSYLTGAQELLESINKDDMDCLQVADYYGAYAYLYFITEGEDGSDVQYYHQLQSDQEDRCQVEYPIFNPETGEYEMQKVSEPVYPVSETPDNGGEL